MSDIIFNGVTPYCFQRAAAGRYSKFLRVQPSLVQSDQDRAVCHHGGPQKVSSVTSIWTLKALQKFFLHSLITCNVVGIHVTMYVPVFAAMVDENG